MCAEALLAEFLPAGERVGGAHGCQDQEIFGIQANGDFFWFKVNNFIVKVQQRRRYGLSFISFTEFLSIAPSQ